MIHRRAGDVLHPEREPAEWLEAARRNLGSLNFSAQYQQNPLPAEGNVIKREWLKTYDHLPDAFDLKIVSWDTASTLGEAVGLVGRNGLGCGRPGILPDRRGAGSLREPGAAAPDRGAVARLTGPMRP